MLRTACIWIALLACVPPAAAQVNFSGTYTTRNAAGGVVTLTLKQDAQARVSGTLSGNDNTFTVQAEVRQGNLLGTLVSPQGALFILAEPDGEGLRVMLAEPGPGGQPDLERSQMLLMTRGTPVAKPGAPAAAGAAAPAAPAGGAPTDAQAAQFLTANAWCGFTFNQRSGTSTRERVVFGADGWVARSSGAETYSSGPAGTVAGQYGNAERARWRVRNMQLELSPDGANWAPQPLSVTRNSNGAPIIKSGGREYMVCR